MSALYVEGLLPDLLLLPVNFPEGDLPRLPHYDGGGGASAVVVSNLETEIVGKGHFLEEWVHFKI